MEMEQEPARKHDRILEIYNRLVSGEIIKKQELAEEYGVNPRSIQRDIDSIRDFYSNRAIRYGEVTEIKYDRIAKGFRIDGAKAATLTNAELFAVSKIILESRSLCKEEIEKIVTDLIDACLPEPERKKFHSMVLNELFHYAEPGHGKNLINTLWELEAAVCARHWVQLEYKKAGGQITNARIKPVGIMNSEYYFYLIAYIGDKDKEHPGYPTFYRIDRIEGYKVTGEIFHMPYRNRFEEGEFRKRLQFMYGGPLSKVEFVYTGPDVNAVLDRLPTADCTKLKDGSYRIKAEAYGTTGINMWLRSQGDYIKGADCT